LNLTTVRQKLLARLSLRTRCGVGARGPFLGAADDEIDSRAARSLRARPRALGDDAANSPCTDAPDAAD